MSTNNVNNLPGPAPDSPVAAFHTAVPIKHSFWWKFWLVLKTIQARLRFVAILLAVGGGIAYWDTLKAYYEKWTRPATHEEAASSDVEYFCPMHPQIIRDNNKEKCPICFMPLSRRKKGTGTEEPLPAGVVSRVQLSPYRVALAGTQTTEVVYRPLAKEITTVGFVEFDERKLARISARLPGRSRIDKLMVNVTGQTVHKGDELALLYSPDLVVTVQNLLDAQKSSNQTLQSMSRERLRLWGIDDDQIDTILKTGQPITRLTIRSPISGHVIRKYQVEGEYVEEGARLYDVADLSTVWIQAQVYERDLGLLKEGMPISAETEAFPNREFKGRVAFITPHLDQNSRTLTVRLDVDNPGHALRPGMYAAVKLRVSPAQLEALSGQATKTQRAELQKGLALAVPESSVIDTGNRKIVYKQATPGVFEGVQVRLGPRMVGPDDVAFYPVIGGLEAGDRVVTTGSFLIDAETRLNPATGSIYFGGSGGKGGQATVSVRPSTPEDDDTREQKIKAALAKLGAEDRRLAEAQKFCPILEVNRLGSMGKPYKLILKGKPVFLCCSNCVEEAQADPEGTLAKVQKLTTSNAGAPQDDAKSEGLKESPPVISAPQPGGVSDKEAKIKGNLAKLSDEDRRLAEAQKYCPNDPENRLGSMGIPLKVIIKEQPVFLCCKGCKEDAMANPDRILATLEQLKAKVKTETARP